MYRCDECKKLIWPWQGKIVGPVGYEGIPFHTPCWRYSQRLAERGKRLYQRLQELERAGIRL
jgi:hypothetical protein